MAFFTEIEQTYSSKICMVLQKNLKNKIKLKRKKKKKKVGGIMLPGFKL